MDGIREKNSLDVTQEENHAGGIGNGNAMDDVWKESVMGGIRKESDMDSTRKENAKGVNKKAIDGASVDHPARLIASGLANVLYNAVTPGLREECMHLLGTANIHEMEHILYQCVYAQLDIRGSADELTAQANHPNIHRISPGSTLDRILEGLEVEEMEAAASLDGLTSAMVE